MNDGRHGANGAIQLRDVTEADLPIFYEHQLDPEATRMADFPSRGRDAYMKHWERVLANDSNITKTILVDGAVAGNIASFMQSGMREVGYWIGKDYWGRGVATAALALLLAHDQTRPLYAHVVRHNIGSIRVLEKCGFEIVDSAPADDPEAVLLRLDT